MNPNQNPSTLQTATVQEACSLLRVSRPTLFRMLKSGELPSLIVGRRNRRIPLAAIRRMLDEAMEKAG
ncbi:MAG: helix-turn-helix domain-containing protein [Armatimonadota bacterium]